MVAYLEVAKPHMEKCYMTLSKVRASTISSNYGGVSCGSQHSKREKTTARERVYTESVVELGVRDEEEKNVQGSYSGVIWLKPAHQKEE